MLDSWRTLGQLGAIWHPPRSRTCFTSIQSNFRFDDTALVRIYRFGHGRENIEGITIPATAKEQAIGLVVSQQQDEKSHAGNP